jgi:hypothetical protein
MHSRAREICGNLYGTSMHFQALSCNGRLPKSLEIRYLVSHNAGVEGSSPSLSTNQISAIATQAESAFSP